MTMAVLINTNGLMGLECMQSFRCLFITQKRSGITRELVIYYSPVQSELTLIIKQDTVKQTFPTVHSFPKDQEPKSCSWEKDFSAQGV